MRTVNIDFTGADAPVNFFAGYTGEANNTQLTIRLPENLCSEDIDYYRIHFKTGAQENIRSEKLYAQEGVITLTLWYELLRNSGTLLMQVSAYDFEDNELVRLGKTPIAALKIRPSLAAGMEANQEIYGLEAEFEELIRLHSKGDCSVMADTFTDLPDAVLPGTLALVRNPPPRYMRQCIRPIVANARYPRLYINPYPPRPEHVYTGDDSFAEALFVNGQGNYYESEPTLYFRIFDGTDEGYPIMLQIVPDIAENKPMYVYAWDAFDLSEELHILPGWYRAYIDYDTGDLITIEAISAEEIPVIEYAGMTDVSSVYLGYYLSPEPYFQERLNSLFVFDGNEWKPFDDADISIKPIGTIPVRGITFLEYSITYNLGEPYQVTAAKVFPSFANNKHIDYVIGDETVLAISWETDEEGIPVLYATGLKAGTTTLTAVTQEGGYSKSMTITVQEG
ncbi:MAG TPA: hypothetical protein PLD68_09785 [Clostridiales bacterium]|nr:hypothetical protein [Clostridiales bacterium]